MLETLTYVIQALLIIGFVGFIFGFLFLISFTDLLDPRPRSNNSTIRTTMENQR